MEENYRLIEQYMAGELDPKALADFKRRLETEEELRQQLALFQDIDLLEEIKSDTNLQGALSGLGEAHFEGENKAGSGGRYKRLSFWLPALVAILAVAFLTLAMYLALRPPLHERLYAEITHDKLDLVTKGQGVREAVEMEGRYNSGRYESVTPMLEVYLDQHPEATNARLALGISLLEQEKYELARTEFRRIHAGNTAFKEDGTFYLAISYLKQNRLGECRDYLEKIPKDYLGNEQVEYLYGKLRN